MGKITYYFEENLPNGKVYENHIEFGKEYEWLDGVGLKNGHYCKYYSQKRDWQGESIDAGVLDRDKKPVLQHYCLKENTFMGYCCCCMTNAKCFEEGKSAGIKRILNRIRKERGYVVSAVENK